MGYGVYEDWSARSLGVVRWAGYMVPAVCDVAECTEQVNRGLGYRCEEYEVYPDDESDDTVGEIVEGCGLTFCGTHLDHHGHGDTVKPKPDSLEWRRWQLYEDSWAAWRGQNPEIVAAIIGELNGGDASQERTLLLHVKEQEEFVFGNSMILNPGEDPSSWESKGWTVAETHMPPFSDPRTPGLIELVKSQWHELNEA